MRPSRSAAVIGAVVVQIALLLLAVAPRLSARVRGDDYLVRVAPLDPIDPFRGAYVTLSYPDFAPVEFVEGLVGDVFVPLVEGAEGLWRGAGLVDDRPESGPYLRCRYDGSLRCGIESLFLSQDRARAAEADLADGAVARISVDGDGNAAVIELLAPTP